MRFEFKIIFITVSMLLGIAVSGQVNAAPTLCSEYGWTMPTTDVGGNPLAIDGGVRFYAKDIGGNYTLIADVADPSLNTYPISSLFTVDGTHNLAVTAYMQSGRESDYAAAPSVSIVGGIAYNIETEALPPAQVGELIIRCTISQ